MFAGSVGVAGQATIPEAARAKGKDFVTEGSDDRVQPVPLDELTKLSRLVLIGTLTKGRSYLTPSQEHMETRYQIAPEQVLVGQIVTSAKTPGSLPTITLLVYSGQMVMEGVTVTYVDRNYETPLNDRRYLMFLGPYRDEPGVYQIVRGGIFELSAAGTRSLLTIQKNAYDEIAKRPLDQVVADIRQAVKQ